jgi:hypothetical protein
VTAPILHHWHIVSPTTQPGTTDEVTAYTWTVTAGVLRFIDVDDNDVRCYGLGPGLSWWRGDPVVGPRRHGDPAVSRTEHRKGTAT